MDSLNELLAFVQVLRSGSFTAAANRLGISTTAVSKSVTRLERRLETRLINRTTRSISPTAEGLLFFEHVEAGLNRIDQAVDLVREAREGPSGLIRVSSVTYFGRHLLLPLVPDFLEAQPKVSLEINMNDSMPDLVSEGFDVGIVHGRPAETRYVCRSLYRLPLVLVASASYLSRNGEPRRPEDLAGHDCIVVLRLSGERYGWSFSPAGQGRSSKPSERHMHYPKGRLVLSKQVDTAVDAALMGLGITVAFVESVLPHLESGRLRVLLPEFQVDDDGHSDDEIFVQYPHREYMSAKVRVFVDFLVERFRSYETLDYSPKTLKQRFEPHARRAPQA